MDHIAAHLRTSAQRAQRRLADGFGAPSATHLLTHADDADQARQWLEALCAALRSAGGWEIVDADTAAGAKLLEGRSGTKAWYKAHRSATRKAVHLAVTASAEAWNRAMTPEDEVDIYTLRKRLGETTRVHVVAIREPMSTPHRDPQLLLARQRLEMVMNPWRAAAPRADTPQAEACG